LIAQFPNLPSDLKMLPEIPEPILLAQIFAKLTSIGRIHNVSTAV
jgi:putative transposase